MKEDARGAAATLHFGLDVVNNLDCEIELAARLVRRVSCVVLVSSGQARSSCRGVKDESI